MNKTLKTVLIIVAILAIISILIIGFKLFLAYKINKEARNSTKEAISSGNSISKSTLDATKSAMSAIEKMKK